MWGDMDAFMRDMEEYMRREFNEFSSNVPKDLVREKKLRDGSTVKEWGPFVYGYSMTIGPDGKPVIREFGNVRPSLRSTPRGFPRPSLDVKEEREPLVDVISTESEVKVVAELPGVEKSDIQLHGTEDTLTIEVETPQRRYFKQIDIPEKVDPTTAKSTYKNGVLEVTLSKVKVPKPKGERINVE